MLRFLGVIAVIVFLLWLSFGIGIGVVLHTVGVFFAGVLAGLAVFFAVSGWPFWLLLAIAVGVGWYFEEHHENGWLVLIPFGVFCLFAQFVARFDLLSWTRTHAGPIVKLALLYFVIGVLYSLTRWIMHLREKSKEIDALEAEFRRTNPFEGPLDKETDEVRYKFTKFITGKYNPDLDDDTRRNYNPRDYGLLPQFNRSAFTNMRRLWWWPFSILGFVINDLVRKVFEFVKDFLADAYNWAANKIFGRRAGYGITGAKFDHFLYEEQEKQRQAEREANRAQSEKSKQPRGHDDSEYIGRSTW